MYFLVQNLYNRYFPSYLKLFLFIFIMHILFCWTYQKNLLQKGMKDWTFEVYLLTGELSSWFRLIESLKMTCARSYLWFLNFLSSGGCLDCFLKLNVLPNLSKITVTCPKSLKWMGRVNFDLPKVSRMTINFELIKVSKMTSLKIYMSEVTKKLERSNLDIK